MIRNFRFLQCWVRLCALAALMLESFTLSEAAPKVSTDPLPSVEVAASEVPELTARAEAGDAKAQIRLGHYLMMHHEPGYANEKKAGEWFLKAAESGDAEGQAWYGIYVATIGGKSEGPSISEALEWSLKSARQGNAVGQYMAGLLTHYTNEEQQIAWYEKSARQGFAPAQRALGICMIDNYPVGSKGKKFAEARKWLEKAAKAGDGEACLILSGAQGGIQLESWTKKSEKYLRTAIERAAARTWRWYDTVFDLEYYCPRYSHGGARYFLANRAYTSLSNIYWLLHKEALYRKTRDGLAIWMKQCAEEGDPAANLALGLLFKYYKTLNFHHEEKAPEDYKIYLKKVIDNAPADDGHAQRLAREAQKKLN